MQKKQVNAVVVNAPHDVKKEIRQVEWNDDQVLIKVERGGICGSDIHYFLHGRGGMSILKTPMILGHEFVGTVEQAPAEIGLTAGQRVAVNPSQPCQTCRYCREGKQNLCRAMRFMGSAQFFREC